MRRNNIWKMGFIFVIVIFQICFSLKIFPNHQIPEHSKYFLIIDYDYMNCVVCQNSLSKYIDQLIKKAPEDVVGILVFPKNSYDTERKKRIQQKQLRGFKIGNSIHFQFYFDYEEVFSSFKGKGASLIELDYVNREVKSSKISLSTIQIERIFSFFEGQ